MVWCHESPSHNLNQCWPRSLMHGCIARRQEVKFYKMGFVLAALHMRMTDMKKNSIPVHGLSQLNSSFHISEDLEFYQNHEDVVTHHKPVVYYKVTQITSTHKSQFGYKVDVQHTTLYQVTPPLWATEYSWQIRSISCMLMPWLLVLPGHQLPWYEMWGEMMYYIICIIHSQTSHYLNQQWLVYWRIYASLGLNELSLVISLLCM